jgi:hypothetical protein
VWTPETWEPDSIQLPTSFVQAALTKRVPAESLLALAAFLLNRPTPPKAIVETIGLDRDTALIAWKFLETGQIVTSDGVIETETRKTSTAPVVASPNKTSDTGETFGSWLGTELARYFPQATPFVPTVLDQIVEKLDGDRDWATDIFLTIKGIPNVQKPTGMFIHHVRNVSRDEVAQKAAAERNKKPTTDDILDTVLAQAATRMKDLPPPGPSEEEVKRRKAMNDAAEAQDWDDDGTE